MTAAAPSWVVTFLFTDVEGLTSRWEADAEGMKSTLAAHDEVLRSAIETHGGFLLKRTGDGICVAFSFKHVVDAAAALKYYRVDFGRDCSGALLRSWHRRATTISTVERNI